MTMGLSSTLAAGKRLPFTRTFESLRHRDYRLYWLALTVSLFGASLQTVAQSWLIYRLTGSPVALGVSGFVPALVAAPLWPLGGVIADRVSRRTLIICTQTLSMLPPLALAWLTWTDRVQVWHVVAGIAVLAFIAAVDWPARMALIPQLVPPADLGNAQALGSLTYQLIRVIGPAAAGLVIAATGEAACFALNGLSYGALVLALLAMRIRPRPSARRQAVGASLLEGYRYVLKTPALIGLLGIIGLQSVFLTSYVTLMPVYAKDILGVGSAGLGLMNSAVGVGAVAGALAIGRVGPGGRGRFLAIAGLGLPIALGAFAWSRQPLLAASLLAVVGLGTVALTTTTVTELMLTVPDEFRGRVSSVASMLYLGGPPAGGLPLAWMAQHWGSPVALSASAALFLLGAMVLYYRLPGLRRV